MASSFRVYSTRFLSVAVPNIWNYFTVPAGKRAVVRCITLVLFDDPPGMTTLPAPAPDPEWPAPPAFQPRIDRA